MVNTSSAGTAPRVETLTAAEERFFVASQWQLMWWKYKKHKLAIAASVIIILLYFGALFCEFFAPYDLHRRNMKYVFSTPQRLHFHDGERFHLRPFVYGLTRTVNKETLRKTYTEDKSVKYSMRFWVRGDPYRFWGLFETDIHLFGVEEGGVMFLLGTDRMGRDMLSRVLYGARVSLSIGLIGVFMSLVLGLILGGISGYYGGNIDTLIQRVIEILRSFPSIPLWMALSAALPIQWSPIRVYFGITIILSLLGWTGLARMVRGKLLSLREEDYVMAALVSGSGEMQIIVRHLLPSIFSHIIVTVTVAIPSMILAETALSFLGIGLRPPVTSWGVLLQEAQNFRTVSLNPWLLIPVFFVIATVLAFNFIGDGLRDAADPYGGV